MLLLNVYARENLGSELHHAMNCPSATLDASSHAENIYRATLLNDSQL